MESPTIVIVRQPLRREALGLIAARQFGDMVKAVVDVDREVMAVGGELQSDEEAILLEDGSAQAARWGINLYPAESGEAFVEFDSMINVRPAQGNRSRGIDSEVTRSRILGVVRSLVSDS